MAQIADRTRVLLASQMSARCDRALDRAAQLARAWKAELVVIHALDTSGVERNQRLSMSLPSWRVPEQWQERVARRLREDIRDAWLAASRRRTTAGARPLIASATSWCSTAGSVPTRVRVALLSAH